jgi:hypothetical protein
VKHSVFLTTKKNSAYLLIFKELDVRNILGLKTLVFLKIEEGTFLRNKNTMDKTQLITEVKQNIDSTRDVSTISPD